MIDDGTGKYKPEDFQKEPGEKSGSDIEGLADMIADAMQAADEREQDTGSFENPLDDTGEFEPVNDKK